MTVAYTECLIALYIGRRLGTSCARARLPTVSATYVHGVASEGMPLMKRAERLFDVGHNHLQFMRKNRHGRVQRAKTRCAAAEDALLRRSGTHRSRAGIPPNVVDDTAGIVPELSFVDQAPCDAGGAERS
jgi:hypothetical protein